MSSINKHLGSNEKIIFVLKPSRRAFLGDYVSIMVLVLAAIGARISVTLTFLTYMFITLSVALLIKIESGIGSKRYFITNERIIRIEGTLKKRFNSCVYNRITEMKVSQSFFEKYNNTGTLIINTGDNKSSRIILEKISNPSEVKKKIDEIYSAAARGLYQPAMHPAYINPNQMQQPIIQPSQIHIHIHNQTNTIPDQQQQHAPNQLHYNIRR